MDIRLSIWTAGIDRASLLVEVWKWPVDKIEIEIIEPQIGQRLLAGLNHTTMRIVPDFRGNEELFPRHAPVHDNLQCVAHFLLITVDRGTVEKALSILGCTDNGVSHLNVCDVVRPKGSQTRNRNVHAIVEVLLWNDVGVDPIF